MRQFVILGSGAAPGVPAVCGGWGNCDSKNPKNRRTRTTSCLKYDGVTLLIDTSPDLRQQLLNSGIRDIDAVLYTHAHADHLHGIDELREINRQKGESLDFYASEETIEVIKVRFAYLIAQQGKINNVRKQPSLVAHPIEYYKPFYVKHLKITPIKLLGHNMPTVGYIFNDGEIVYIADYRQIDERAFDYIKVPVKLLVIPLTTPKGETYHASFDDIMKDAKKIGAEKVVINHMAIECDYQNIKNMLPENMAPAYDNLVVDLE